MTRLVTEAGVRVRTNTDIVALHTSGDRVIVAGLATGGGLATQLVLYAPNGAAAVVNTQVDKSRWVTLEFDANAHGLQWDFKPVQRSVRVHPGEMIQIEYDVRNNGAEAIVGQAIPSYGPKHAAPFVKKMECFCFKQQPLQAGEAKRMPVQFVIDSTLPASVNTITLSYTFFEVKGASTAPAKSAGQG